MCYILEYPLKQTAVHLIVGQIEMWKNNEITLLPLVNTGVIVS